MFTAHTVSAYGKCFLEPFTVSTSVHVVSISAYIDSPAGVTTGGSIMVGIYSKLSTAPARLLWLSPSQLASVGHINTISAQLPSIPAGSYYLALEASSTLRIADNPDMSADGMVLKTQWGHFPSLLVNAYPSYDAVALKAHVCSY